MTMNTRRSFLRGCLGLAAASVFGVERVLSIATQPSIVTLIPQTTLSSIIPSLLYRGLQELRSVSVLPRLVQRDPVALDVHETIAIPLRRLIDA